MNVWVGIFIGAAFGFFLAAVLMGLSYRRELEDRDAWEKAARNVLRDVATTTHYPGWLRQQARRLLADEAGC